MSLALHARQCMSEKPDASFLSQHPGPVRPGRMVTYMARMAALQFRYPVASFVLVKACNPSFQNLASPEEIVRQAPQSEGCWNDVIANTAFALGAAIPFRSRCR